MTREKARGGWTTDSVYAAVRLYRDRVCTESGSIFALKATRLSAVGRSWKCKPKRKDNLRTHRWKNSPSGQEDIG